MPIARAKDPGAQLALRVSAWDAPDPFVFQGPDPLLYRVKRFRMPPRNMTLAYFKLKTIEKQQTQNELSAHPDLRAERVPCEGAAPRYQEPHHPPPGGVLAIPPPTTLICQHSPPQTSSQFATHP